MSDKLIHGGDIEGFILEYGSKPLDFSANCNPLGLAPGIEEAVVRSLKYADAYPDPLSRELRNALEKFECVPAKNILCGNGSADLIFRLALALSKRTGKALVTAPTFAEYEQASSAAGLEVDHFQLRESNDFELTDSFLNTITENYSVVFVCNPNNPTGRTVSHELLVKIAKRCLETGTILVLDECFVSFIDRPEENTLKHELKANKNLVILKAYTKLYGMAGLRLGYCMSSNIELLEEMRECGQPWSVSSTAQAAGIAALKECDFVDRSLKLISEQRKLLKTGLIKLGMKVYGGDANYIFFSSHIINLTSLMRKRGVLIRDCGNYVGLKEGYYRVAVRTGDENAMLLKEMKAAVDDASGIK